MTLPTMTMVAGPNGSGKTTLTRHLQEAGFDLGVYINPDDIAASFDADDKDRSWRAQLKADRLRHDCLARRVDFTFETVMSHPSKVKFLETARQAGFHVMLVFIGIDDPATNVARVRQRVALGGHDVPAERVIARWHRTMALLPDAIRRSDRAILFDNSATIGAVGQTLPPPVVAEFRQGTLVAQSATVDRPAWLAACLAALGS